MRRYTQLTRGKRYQIRALLKAGISQSKMASYLKVHKSTISREIRRNRGHKGHRPWQAHEMAMARRFQAPKRIKMSPAMIILVSHYIRQDFSPARSECSADNRHSPPGRRPFWSTTRWTPARRSDRNAADEPTGLHKADRWTAARAASEWAYTKILIYYVTTNFKCLVRGLFRKSDQFF